MVTHVQASSEVRTGRPTWLLPFASGSGGSSTILFHSLRPPVLRVHQCLLLLGHHGSDCLMLRRLPHSIIIFQSLACLLVLLHCWGCLLTRPNVFVFAFISWCVLLSNIGWDMCRGLNLWRGLETDLWRELRGWWASRGMFARDDCGIQQGMGRVPPQASRVVDHSYSLVCQDACHPSFIITGNPISAQKQCTLRSSISRGPLVTSVMAACCSRVQQSVCARAV